MKKKILICGITGTIGVKAIDVIKKENYELVGFSFNKNINLAKQILKEFPSVYVYSPSKKKLNNVENYTDLFQKSNPDIVLNAIVGFAGLEITELALNNDLDIALANKESMVVAGWYINDLLKKTNAKIYPVDSEHCSIYDILINTNKKVKQIYITASGGPFFEFNENQLANVKFEQAIAHPTWNMGYKISIDSATLINKYFEIIEAFYLFNTKNIKTIRHKTSIVHSIVHFEDNSFFMNASNPDMRLPIEKSLSEFKSNSTIIESLDLNNLILEFEKIDVNKWKPIKWAYDFLEQQNKAIPIIVNAANEVLIELFKEDKINFLDIINVIDKLIDQYKNFKIFTIKDIYNLDKTIRILIQEGKY